MLVARSVEKLRAVEKEICECGVYVCLCVCVRVCYFIGYLGCKLSIVGEGLIETLVTFTCETWYYLLWSTGEFACADS